MIFRSTSNEYKRLDFGALLRSISYRQFKPSNITCANLCKKFAYYAGIIICLKLLLSYIVLKIMLV